MKLLAIFFVFLFSLLALPFSANAQVEVGCGDGFCDSLLGENSASCPADCAVDVVVPFCGDGFCDNLLGEDSSSCPSDCGAPAPPQPPAPVVPVCGDNFCDSLLGENAVSCPADCAVDVVVPVCGDGFCDNLLGEDNVSCPADCALPPPPAPVVPFCGDNFCDNLLGENSSSCPADCAIPPPEPPAPVAPPANNPPVITAFNVPPTADKNTDITLSVTATDNDGSVNRIEILKDNIVIAVQSCGNIISCTKSFIVRVPDAFNAIYTFIARVFDNDRAVATATGSGRTNPALAFEAAHEPLRVSIPSDELFISSLVPDTGCLAPGDETFLYISLKNTGRSTLDDVKITAIVLDSDIRAVSGPFVIRKGDSASRFLYFIVPENTKPGEYYIKAAVTFGADSVVKYRIFEISRAC